MSRRRELSVLVTVLFTDIVGSTEIAAELGDRRWRDLVGRHHAIVRRELKRFRGRELDTAGDGFFARFERPADAIRCACAVSDEVRELGIEIRAGIHVGEAEVFEHKVGGIAVNVAARVMGVAEGGEVLVSSTLRDAVAGSGFAFADHGTHRLKGIEGEWRLFEVTSVDGERRSLPLSEEEARSRRGFSEAVPARGHRGLIVGAAVLVVALIGGGIALSGEDNHAHTKIIETPPYRALLTKVPPAFRTTCRVAAVAPSKALASVECHPTEMYDVTYSSFGSLEAMQAPFEGFASPADLTNLDCSREPSARGEYTIFGRRAGEVACFVREGSSLSTTDSVIAWTDEELLVLGQAVRGDAADVTLYEWWRDEAGPWDSSKHLPKDGEPRVLEGSFEAAAGPRELRFINGHYSMSEHGVVYVVAELLYAKPSTIVLFHRIATPTFGGVMCPNYESFDWRLRGDALDLTLTSDSCTDYASRDIADAKWTRVA
jgi:class 3 adenylate cyclase